jgi:hypothetical protein
MAQRKMPKKKNKNEWKLRRYSYLVGSTNGVFAWDRRVICTIQIWGIGLDWTSSFPPFTPKVNAHKKGREGMTAQSNKAIKHPCCITSNQPTNRDS